MLQEFYILEYHKATVWTNVRKSWHMQDKVSSLGTQRVLEYYDEFGSRIIALNINKHFTNGLSWPLHSLDFNPCNFYLWGYLKNKYISHRILVIFKGQVYIPSNNDLAELKLCILIEIWAIKSDTLKLVIH